MPIYKITRRGLEERRARVIFNWVRFAALAISAGLLTSATMLLLHATH